MKESLTFKMLTDEIKRTFNYKYEDAEKYAEYLRNLALVEYRNAYKELTVTKEGIK